MQELHFPLRRVISAPMNGKDLTQWRLTVLGENVTQRGAADRLGLSRRMYCYYEAGEFPIPLSVRLACAAITHGLTGPTDYRAPRKGK